MNTIDPALEKRVWQRICGRELPQQDTDVYITQLYRTARDCAELYRLLKLESSGPAAQRFALLERQMLQALRRLARLLRSEAAPQGDPAGCPGCSRRQKLERAVLWMQEWTRRCTELDRLPRMGKELSSLAALGENHCSLLRSMLGHKR